MALPTVRKAHPNLDTLVQRTLRSPALLGCQAKRRGTNRPGDPVFLQAHLLALAAQTCPNVPLRIRCGNARVACNGTGVLSGSRQKQGGPSSAPSTSARCKPCASQVSASSIDLARQMRPASAARDSSPSSLITTSRYSLNAAQSSSCSAGHQPCLSVGGCSPGKYLRSAKGLPKQEARLQKT
eukprot:CAMPEP_0180580886 /NCGR_PEP_ID=MMETSP1037_2-20121125/13761_1 /TAXON_ID=632150 /ORGANISM="Azadinium spinosum, Strain 3D9" /LENGTH=182 /DNA_ID=CAMNT_0022598839 /DNA_START=619 /DNA_END=1164 /DNA_ORIENTATION=-